MRRIILLRHGEAEAHGPDGDRSRRLTKVGHAASVRVGQELRARGLTPDLILSSDAVRAVETLEGVVHGGSFVGVPFKKLPILYLADPSVILDRLYEVEDSVSTVLLIGHNPGWSDVASELAAIPVGLDTAEAAWLEKKFENFSADNSWASDINSPGAFRLRGILP